MAQQTIATARGSVVIRPTQQDDAGTFRALRLEALQTAPAAFGMDYEASAAQPDSHWQERAQSIKHERITFVAEADTQIVGMTGIFREPSSKQRHAAVIWGVYVQPQWRGAQLADTLVNACLAWGRTEQIRLARLGVVATNASAIRCYLRCGFSVYGVEPETIFYNGLYYDELLMYCRLNNDFQGAR